MDKRLEMNLEVKRSMTYALLMLLNQKTLSEITIKELVEKAGVARASFYRNFSSKEELLSYFLNTLLLQYKEKYDADLAYIARYDNVLRTFTYIYSYRNELHSLFKAKLGQMVLDAINEYIITSTNLIYQKQLIKYPFYSYAGALYNVIYYWITSGCKESPKEITEVYFNSLHL